MDTMAFDLILGMDFLSQECMEAAICQVGGEWQGVPTGGNEGGNKLVQENVGDRKLLQ